MFNPKDCPISCKKSHGIADLRNMKHSLVKFLFLAFILISHPTWTQDQPDQQEQIDQKDFFDSMDAPITYKGAFIKMMLTLLALIALIVISVWMLRRISRGRMKQMNFGRTIKVLERRPLSAKSILYLIEVSGKKVLISESQLEIQTITTADHLPVDED